jgi:hypothetical protein
MCVFLVNVSMNCWCLLEPSSALKVIVRGNLVWGSVNFVKLAAVLQTSALGGPTLSTRTDTCVDIKLFSGAVAREVR